MSEPFCAQMRAPRDHHSRLPAADTVPMQQPLNTEPLPSKSTLVTYPSANGKPVSFVAKIPTPEDGSSTASASTVANRSHLLETLFEHVSVPPTKRFKAEAEPDRVAQLISIAKRDQLGGPFATAATAVGVGTRTLSRDEQLELVKLLKCVCATCCTVVSVRNRSLDRCMQNTDCEMA